MIPNPRGTQGNKNLLHATSAGFKGQLGPAVLGGARAPLAEAKFRTLTSRGAQLSCLMSWRRRSHVRMPGALVALMVGCANSALGATGFFCGRWFPGKRLEVFSRASRP